MESVGPLKITQKLVHILKGWARRFNLIPTPVDLKQISEDRLWVCLSNEGVCARRTKLLQILNGEAEYVNTLVCTKCHCPCLEKSLVREETCPLKKWEK